MKHIFSIVLYLLLAPVGLKAAEISPEQACKDSWGYPVRGAEEVVNHCLEVLYMSNVYSAFIYAGDILVVILKNGGRDKVKTIVEDICMRYYRDKKDQQILIVDYGDLREVNDLGQLSKVDGAWQYCPKWLQSGHS